MRKSPQQFLRELDAVTRLPQYMVIVKTTDTSSPIQYARGWRTERRTDVENLVILRSHIVHGRNPVFFRQDDKNWIRDEWKNGINRVMRGGITNVSENIDLFLDTGKRVAKILIGIIRMHIDRGESERGAMKPLAEAYKKRKNKYYSDKPILYKTGQMYNGLVFSVVKQ